MLRKLLLHLLGRPVRLSEDSNIYLSLSDTENKTVVEQIR